MKTSFFTSLILIVSTIALVSFELPSNWFMAGSKPKSYDMGIDRGAGLDSKNAATIKSIDKKVKGFGTLMQDCLPDKFMGKRLRMTAYVKTKDVAEWAGLWMRIDQKGSSETLGFDNMHAGKNDRSIKGTTDWTKYEIVMDVPHKASNIAYGALLVGTGQIWFDKLSFEIVDNTVATTNSDKEAYLPNKEPMNLDFEN